MFASCVICGDAFQNGVDISAVSCGHTFHTVCVLQWFENSKTCPQCRVKTSEKKLVKLFFDSTDQDGEDQDPTTLKSLLSNAKFQTMLKEQELTKIKEEHKKEKEHNIGLREEIKKRNEEAKISEELIRSLESRLNVQDSMGRKVKRLQEEKQKAVAALSTMQDIQLLLSGCEKEVSEMLKAHHASDNEAARSLASMVMMLKKEVIQLSNKKNNYIAELRLCKSSLRTKKNEVISLESQNKSLREKVVCLKEDVDRLEENNTGLSKKIDALESAMLSPSTDNVANGVLRRLLREDVIPHNIKKQANLLRSDGDEFINTPVVVKRKKVEEENDDPLDSSSDMFYTPKKQEEALKKELPSTLLLKSLELNKTRHDDCKDSSSPYLKVKSRNVLPTTILSRRPGLTNIGVLRVPPKTELDDRRESGVSYDGMGGHHKVDVFSKRNVVVLKKRSYNKKPVTMSMKNGSTKTITNFFRNTFDD